jgi:hypothetical protein
MSSNSDGKYGLGRWVRNKRLAAYMTVSDMTVWRWKRDPKLKTPPSSVINGIEYNDLDAWDLWMRTRAVSHIEHDPQQAA